jgi:hypothetical protein
VSERTNRRVGVCEKTYALMRKTSHMKVNRIKLPSWAARPTRKILGPILAMEAMADIPPPVAWMRKVTTDNVSCVSVYSFATVLRHSPSEMIKMVLTFSGLMKRYLSALSQRTRRPRST